MMGITDWFKRFRAGEDAASTMTWTNRSTT